MAATTTTLQVGAINFLTDTFTSTLDLNDGATFRIQDVQFMQPDRLYSEAFNMRTPGVQVQAAQYGNGAIRVRLYVQAANTTAILSAIHSLFSAIETPPYYLKVQLAGGSQFTYFQVVKVAKPQIPYQAQKYLSGFALGFDLTFTVLPKGITLPRQYLSNLINNPGFEAVSNTPITAFSDPFANTNAYAVQAGSAPTLSPANTFVDVVMNNGGSSMVRYYRLGEAANAQAYDIGGSNQTGTYTNGPITLGVAGGVSGDTDTAITLASASSQYVDCPTVGLPTGNAAFTLLCRFKFAANPGANAWLMCYGSATSGAHNVVGMFINSTGKLVGTCNVGGAADAVTTGAVTTGVYHTAALTWDGTTLSLYLDGALASNALPGANTIPASAGSNRFRLGATADTTAAGFYSGQLDECMVWNVALSSGQISNIHTAAASGATGTVANAMSLPAGARVAFGSPAWQAMQTWQVRFRWVSGLTPNFDLHYTDANNYLYAQLFGTTFQLGQVVAGTNHVLANNASVILTHEAWYWLKVTQYPPIPGSPVGVQASLYFDDAGAIGAPVTNAALGPVNTFDGVTAVSGKPQISTSGAALTIGGNFAGVHQVSLFGPGGWLSLDFLPNNTYTPAGYAWEGAAQQGASGNTTNPYPNGPVTSYGAARIDLPPTGAFNASWYAETGGSPSQIKVSNVPVRQPTDTFGWSMQLKGTGFAATTFVSIGFNEYDASGNFIAQHGPTTSNGSFVLSNLNWQTLSGTYVPTSSSCAYVLLFVGINDSNTSTTSNGKTLWLDNMQVWNQTATGQASMPFCELRFNAAPAQLMVSGLVGDAPAPAFIALAAFFASWTTNATASYQLGRRAVATKGMRLVTASLGPEILDATAYGGFACTANLGPLIYTSADELGIYHILGRAKSANVSPANNVWIAPDIPIWNLAVFSPTVVATEFARWDGAKVYPFAAANTWAIVDAGQVILPPSAYTNQTDLTQLVSFLSTASGASTGLAQLTANWVALMPVDGGIESYGLANTGGLGAVTNQWLYLYNDGQRGVTTQSVEISALPNPAVSGGLTNSLGWYPANNHEPIITSGADSVLYLDPTVPTVPSGVQTVPGVNQFLLHATDNTAASLPVAVDMSYYPAYLFPR